MEDDEEFGGKQLVFDAAAVSVLQSILKSSGQEDSGAVSRAQAAARAYAQPGQEPGMEEGFSKMASVKFMITRQDEKGLLELGYSQIQINRIKPQEACDILLAGTKAEPAKGV